MTNYLVSLATLALFAGSASAQSGAQSGQPGKPSAAAKPASAAPAPAATATATPAAAKPAVTLPHYVQAAGSSLGFAFEQAGAQSNGAFRQFTTKFDYDEKNLAASRLDVTVQIGSLDTQDKDRDDTLKSADLFDAAKFPTATFVASSLARGASGVEAVGKLTIRNVTKDLRLPLGIKPTASGLELSGSVTIKRLDYGVGQGEWKSTESAGDPVKITYKVVMAKG
ncbi:MAG TPA: YceI family protein [Steroidobacteraceae bacterium]|nr:YceI family protein [Steroidobacteraceae bacterium]